MAFEYFVKQKVDIAIIEVGLGGRLDSTNVVDPLVTAITPISLDHQHILGSTLSEIAKEKAGIIKKGVPVVMAKQKIDAKKSIISAAKKMNAEIIETGKTKNLKYSQSGTEFSFMSEVFLTPLFGRHQSENAATAIQIVRQFDKKLKMKPYKKVCLKPYGSVECKSFLTNYQSTMMLHIILMALKLQYPLLLLHKTKNLIY